MYEIRIIDNETGYGVEICLPSQTEVLDFISLLSLARNDHIFISVSYEKIDNHKLNELFDWEKGVNITNDETKPLR